MREGRYLIFVFIYILVQSLGFSDVCVVTYFSAIMNKYQINFNVVLSRDKTALNYSSSIRYFHNKPRVMTWNPVKNGHRNQLWFHFIDCYHSELPEVTTSYNQRKTQECSEFLQCEIGVVSLWSIQVKRHENLNTDFFTVVFIFIWW